MRETLEQAKQQAIKAVNAFHADTLTKLTGNATVAERDTWPFKEAAARAFMDGTADETQIGMLSAEAALTGEELLTLAESILAKAKAWGLLIGVASGLRREGLAAIAQCRTAGQIEAVLAQRQAESAAIIVQADVDRIAQSLGVS